MKISKEKLKQIPVLKSRQCVVSKITDEQDVNTAKWYLERKTKEFRPPDRNTNIYNNQLNLLTETQLKDRVAGKLTKLLMSRSDPSDVTDDGDASNVSDVTDIDLESE